MKAAEQKLEADYIRQALYMGWVNFVYIKIDGEVRDATGTTKPDLIPEDKQPVSISASTWPETDDEVIRYFDKDKNAWRSFVTDNLVVFQPV